MHDVFICHASEDKQDVARPLAERLAANGLSVWYDEFSLKLGDSLRAEIDKGLRDSRFGVVILSHSFFAKKWPQNELNGLFAKEVAGNKTILPVWHDLTQSEVTQYSPILADRIAASTALGLDKVAERVLDTIVPGWQHKTSRTGGVAVSPTSIRLHTGEWSVETPVSVLNRGESPAYAVMLRIAIVGDQVPAESLEIDAETQDPPLEIRMGDVIASADQLRFDCSDQFGRQVVLMVLHTLKPRTTRTVKIKGTAPVVSTADVSVVAVNEAPKELLRKGDSQVAISFMPQEDVRVKGVSLVMRRVRG